jgi:hypothetical protein
MFSHTMSVTNQDKLSIQNNVQMIQAINSSVHLLTNHFIIHILIAIITHLHYQLQMNYSELQNLKQEVLSISELVQLKRDALIKK